MVIQRGQAGCVRQISGVKTCVNVHGTEKIFLEHFIHTFSGGTFQRHAQYAKGVIAVLP